MKKFLIAFVVLALFCCKKKKEDAVVEPAPIIPARINSMTATVNGTAWEVLGNQTSNANIDQSVYNSIPKQYVIGGRTDPNLNKNAIHVGFTYTIGTVSLESFTGFYALYYDSTGLSYPVKSGTLNITALDTSHKKSSACDKFKATFSFVTDKFLGQTFTVTNGSIDFEAK